MDGHGHFGFACQSHSYVLPADGCKIVTFSAENSVHSSLFAIKDVLLVVYCNSGRILIDFVPDAVRHIIVRWLVSSWLDVKTQTNQQSNYQTDKPHFTRKRAMSEAKHLVAVIGAGPAGLYAARLWRHPGHMLYCSIATSNRADWPNTASFRQIQDEIGLAQAIQENSR